MPGGPAPSSSPARVTARAAASEHAAVPLLAALDRAAAPLAALLAAATLAAGLLFGTHAATGADAFGYVSQSALWASGRAMWAIPPLGDEGGWPARGLARAPLGYGPARTPDTLAPTYSPGVPWLMAGLRLIAGDAGPYLLTPLLAAGAVWLAFAWVRARSAPVPALAAALLVATSPPWLFQLAWPMSDLPVTAVWLGVLHGIPARTTRGALATGGLLALALLIRPNLVLASGSVWAVAVALDLRLGPRAGRTVRAVGLTAPLVAAALAIAALNLVWRGSVVASGYGTPGDLLQWSAVAFNAPMQARWLLQTRGWAIALGVLVLPWLALRRSTSAQWWPGLVLALTVWVSYAGYGRFTDWWYLRFQLPWWPVATGAACALAWRLGSRRWPLPVTGLLLAAAVVGAAQGLRIARDAGVTRLWLSEQRYVAAGRWLRERTAASTVVLAVQHAGAVAYYGDRRILRFDQIPADAVDARLTHLQREGRRVVLVVDDWEEAEARVHFAGSDAATRLDAPPLAQLGTSPRVRIFDLTPGVSVTTAPELIRIDRLTAWQRLNAPPGSWFAAPSRAWATTAPASRLER